MQGMGVDMEVGPVMIPAPQAGAALAVTAGMVEEVDILPLTQQRGRVAQARAAFLTR